MSTCMLSAINKDRMHSGHSDLFLHRHLFCTRPIITARLLLCGGNVHFTASWLTFYEALPKEKTTIRVGIIKHRPHMRCFPIELANLRQR